MVSADVIISGVLSVSLLVFFAKILAGAFSKIKVPAVLGELFAGIIFGPYALGGYLIIFGHKLIELSEVVLTFSEIGAILILFTAGLEMTFAEFRAVGLKSFVIAGMGVILPFSLGYYSTLFLGYPFPAALIVGAALTATSIAITIKVLEELGKTSDPKPSATMHRKAVEYRFTATSFFSCSCCVNSIKSAIGLSGTCWRLMVSLTTRCVSKQCS